MKRITCFLVLAAASLFTSPSEATDDQPLTTCVSQEEAVEYATQCILANGTKSYCVNGLPLCCIEGDGWITCVRDPKGRVLKEIPDNVQTPSRPIERRP